MLIVNDWNEEERRKQERYSLEVYLKVMDESTQSALGDVVDISMGGMKVLSETPIATAKEFRLWIDMSLESGKKGKVHLQARSIWSAEDVNPGLYNTGFQFLRLSPETRSSIEELIGELMAG